MCKCEVIEAGEYERAIWVNPYGKQVDGFRHTKCGQLMSKFQVLYKVRKPNGKTGWDEMRGK